MFGIYPPMYNSHLKIRVRTKVSGVEMFLVPIHRGLTASGRAQLGHGRKKKISGRLERGVVLLSALSFLLLHVFFPPLIHTAGGVPLFVSAGVHSRQGCLNCSQHVDFTRSLECCRSEESVIVMKIKTEA